MAEYEEKDVEDFLAELSYTTRRKASYYIYKEVLDVIPYFKRKGHWIVEFLGDKFKTTTFVDT